MKRTYVKPMIEAESFSLSQHIASCSGIRFNATSMQCVLSSPNAQGTPMYDLARTGMFLDPTGCLIQAQDSMGNGDDAICYFTSAVMAFTS